MTTGSMMGTPTMDLTATDTKVKPGKKLKKDSSDVVFDGTTRFHWWTSSAAVLVFAGGLWLVSLDGYAAVAGIASVGLVPFLLLPAVCALDFETGGHDGDVEDSS